MTNPEQTPPTIKAPIIKSCTAISAAVGANTDAVGQVKQELITQGLSSNMPDVMLSILSLPWGAIASMLAAFYTGALFAEWFWKKPLRWILVKVGLREAQRKMTHEEWLTHHGFKDIIK